MSGILGCCGTPDQTLLSKAALPTDSDPVHGDGWSLIGAHVATSEAGTTIALDGVLTRRADLIADLTAAGSHIAPDADDATLVLEAWQHWGREACTRLHGSWAFAVTEGDGVFLAHDQVGIRPLYLATVDGCTVFASSITPILRSGVVDAVPEGRTIYRYLRWGVHDESNATFFSGIHRLLPGQCATISGSRVEMDTYTDLEAELRASHKGTYDDAGARAYGDLLTRAVQDRLTEGAATATALTGSLASSAMVGTVDRITLESEADRATEEPTFSLVYPGADVDETPYVEAVTGALGGRVQEHRVEPTADDLRSNLDEFVRMVEEPTSTVESFGDLCLTREAGATSDVLLDARGSDELLGARDEYLPVHLRELRAEGIVPAVKGVAGAAETVARKAARKAMTSAKIRRQILMGRLVHKDFRAKYAGETMERSSDDLTSRRITDLFRTSLPGRLRVADRCARSAGVEMRYPYLDEDSLRHVFGLGAQAVAGSGVNQRILRDAASDRMPKVVADRRRGVSGPPRDEWFMRLKNYFHSIFISEEFAARPYWNQTEVIWAFELWISGRADVDVDVFWRLLHTELWLREFVDSKDSVFGEGVKTEIPVRIKTDLEPNQHKELDWETSHGQLVRRYPLRTELFAREDELDPRVVDRVAEFFDTLGGAGPEHQEATKGRWYLFVSEKIVAITQGRSYFLWEIEVSRSAIILSKFVSKVPHGIGLGAPSTMQLAINEAGMPRMLAASAAGAVGKALRRSGWFYHVVGKGINAIDGPTEYSAYPSNVSAKLPPKDPEKVAERLSAALRERIPEAYRETFGGTVIMDANDVGRDVLGTDATEEWPRLEAMFDDNPLGQGREQTPLAVVFVRD